MLKTLSLKRIFSFGFVSLDKVSLLAFKFPAPLRSCFLTHQQCWVVKVSQTLRDKFDNAHFVSWMILLILSCKIKAFPVPAAILSYKTEFSKAFNAEIGTTFVWTGEAQHYHELTHCTHYWLTNKNFEALL